MQISINKKTGIITEIWTEDVLVNGVIETRTMVQTYHKKELGFNFVRVMARHKKQGDKVQIVRN